MKKLFTLLLVLGLGILLVSGCQQASEEGAVVPETQVANSIAIVAGMSTATDNAVRQALPNVTAGVVSTPVREGDWWKTTVITTADAYSYTTDVYFKVWYNGTEAITQTQLGTINDNNLSKIYVYAEYPLTYEGASFTLKIGSAKTDADCLRYENIKTSPTISGPISVQGSYENTSYSVTLTYSTVELTGGYPYGTADFAATSGGDTIYSGNIEFAGSTATVNVSGGESIEITLVSF